MRESVLRARGERKRFPFFQLFSLLLFFLLSPPTSSSHLVLVLDLVAQRDVGDLRLEGGVDYLTYFFL